MKTKILITTLCATVVAAGCMKDNNTADNEPVVGKFTINATQAEPTDASDAQTRTSLTGNILKWVDDDALGVMKKTDGSVNATFTTRTADITAGGLSAKFTGPALNAGDYVAYYPHKATAPASIATPHVLTGQTQSANTNTHLGTFDFLISNPVTVAQSETTKEFVFHHSLALAQIGFRVKAAGTNAVVKTVTLKAHDALGTPVNAFAQGVYYDPADGTVKASSKGPEITLTVNNSPALSATQDNLTANLLVSSQATTYPYIIDVVVTTDKNPVTFVAARTVASAAGEFKAGRSYAKTLTIDASNASYFPDLYFPDVNFRNYLVSLGFQLSGNGDIDPTNPTNAALLQSTTQLNLFQYGTNNSLIGVKGYLDIGSLKGIELFTNLQVLNISAVADGSNTTDNLALKVDLSKNTKLTQLIASAAHLQMLDLSKLVDLTHLDVSKVIWSSSAPRTINLALNTKLLELRCNESNFNSLDISKNVLLTTLYCQQNFLTSLDISKNPLLVTLDCGNQGIVGNLLNLTLNMTLVQQTAHWLTWVVFGSNGTRVTVSIL